MWRPGDVRSQHTPEHPDPEGIHRPILINLLGPLPKRSLGREVCPSLKPSLQGIPQKIHRLGPAGWASSKTCTAVSFAIACKATARHSSHSPFLGPMSLWVSCGMYTAHGGIAHGMRRCYLYQVLLVGQCCSFGVVSRVAHHYIPSGKLTVGYEKSQYLIGKSTN
jgi:hypothetical protein